MSIFSKITLPAITLLLCLTFLHSSEAAGVSTMVRSHASNVAGSCLGNWENQSCLKAISESTLDLAASYMETLHNNGKTSAVTNIKNHCAAATAATKGEYPANAMKSAYTECANTMYDVSEQTGISPDPSHYQLLVGPIMCLSDDYRCPSIERGLRVYK